MKMNKSVTTRNVTCPVNKVKELILQQYPNYYKRNMEVQLEMVSDFVKEPDVIVMFDYMKESEE